VLVEVEVEVDEVNVSVLVVVLHPGWTGHFLSPSEAPAVFPPVPPVDHVDVVGLLTFMGRTSAAGGNSGSSTLSQYLFSSCLETEKPQWVTMSVPVIPS